MWMLATTLIGLAHSPQPQPMLADELAKPVRLIADDTPIDCHKDIGHAGPGMHDIDGDGKPELLVGNFRGHIDVFERDAASTSPAWKKRGRLQAAGDNFAVPNW